MSIINTEDRIITASVTETVVAGFQFHAPEGWDSWDEDQQHDFAQSLYDDEGGPLAAASWFKHTNYEVPEREVAIPNPDPEV